MNIHSKVPKWQYALVCRLQLMKGVFEGIIISVFRDRTANISIDWLHVYVDQNLNLWLKPHFSWLKRGQKAGVEMEVGAHYVMLGGGRKQCFPSVLSVKPLWIFYKGPWRFNDCKQDITGYFIMRPQDNFHPCLWGQKNYIFVGKLSHLQLCWWQQNQMFHRNPDLLWPDTLVPKSSQSICMTL